jgi:hypothetical protein
MAKASAVLPVPGAPVSNKARPENLRDFTSSTTIPQACYSFSLSFYYLKELVD